MLTFEGAALATPNYGYEKRQKELAKKRKKEEKLKAKADRKAGLLPEDEASSADEPAGLDPTNPSADSEGQPSA
jgi:hypothetical protein